MDQYIVIKSCKLRGEEKLGKIYKYIQGLVSFIDNILERFLSVLKINN